MADVPSSLRKVQQEEVSYRSALSEGLFFKIGGVINWIIDNAGFKLGDIQCSILDEATFQANRTTDWVLMDGRSVIGSDYETETGNTNIPDARGRTLRLKDNGRGLTDDLALGTERGSQNLFHYHYGTPEHFGNVAVMRRTGVVPQDTFNDLANTDNVKVSHVGSLSGEPTGTAASGIINPNPTGFGYAMAAMESSTNVNRAWCTPVAWFSDYDNTTGEAGNGKFFNFPHYVTVDQDGSSQDDFVLTRQGAILDGGFSITPSGYLKGNTIAPNSLAGYNCRVPADGGSETRVPEIHVNYFIKINN